MSDPAMSRDHDHDRRFAAVGRLVLLDQIFRPTSKPMAAFINTFVATAGLAVSWALARILILWCRRCLALPCAVAGYLRRDHASERLCFAPMTPDCAFGFIKSRRFKLVFLLSPR
jgi:hypothetical protein